MRPILRVLAVALTAALTAFGATTAPLSPPTPQQDSATPASTSGAASSAPAAVITPIEAPAERVAQAERAFAAAATPVERLVALYRLQENSVFLPPAGAAAALQRLSQTDSAQQEPLLAAEIASQQAAVALRAGDAAAASAIWRQLGEVEEWQAVGPFDNSNPAAIAKEEGPEKGIDLAAHYAGKQRTVRWRRIPYIPPKGELDLGAYLSPAESASAYLVSWVKSPAAQDVALRLRESGSTRVWVNGQLVFDEEAVHSSSGFDQDAAGAHLQTGWNEILAKVGDTQSSDWHFSLRVTTPAGAPLVLQATAEPPHADMAARLSGTPAKVAVRDLTAMAKAAAQGSATGELNYAWVLNRKQNFNAGDQNDANAFMAAISGLPHDAQAVIDFAEHDNDQSRRYRYLDRLLQRDPGNAQAHLLLGTVELSRNEYWPARSQFEQALGLAPPQGPGVGITRISKAQRAATAVRAPLAALGMAEIYAGVGVRPEVLAWAEALRPVGEQSGAISAPLGIIMRHMGAVHAALEWFEAAHHAEAGNLGLALELADAQRRTGELEASLKTLQQAGDLNGQLPSLMEAQARALAGLGRGPEAMKLLRQAVAEAPDVPRLRVALGELERHFGHLQQAETAWQTALQLNPQDSDLRDRLRLARGGEASQEASFERPYAQDAAKVIAAYKAKPHPQVESGPFVVLADTNVTNIFPSGNTGRYVQQIYRINNSNGADALAVYPVTYDPATEDVRFLTARVIHPDGSSADAPEAGDQPVTQSVGYETFYNVRDKYVEMPPMRAGDFVEIAYRVLPTTLESLYGDYYGDLDQFGGPAPTLFQQYVVITPANKQLYYKPVRFHGASLIQHVDGQTVYRWTAENLPAEVAEPSSPPLIEQSPYIEVSAFETWDQFGRWYRQLIRDTFVMDDEMVQTVNELVKGKKTEAAKVNAIYRWVIQNTHYVALEFGIHGYRPYPVTQVFHRRFGDCKDKASLLIAMLHQAGIRSEFVLVRVRELGVIDPTIPSVADFDHAIVYVPSLNLYLDGTAEYQGANELPAGDQRAFVLRLPVDGDLNGSGPAAVVPAREVRPAPLAPLVTPEQPAAANIVRRALWGELAPNGDLHFELKWTLSGGQAPMFRQALELPERRAGALQAMLHDKLPGITVISASVENENNWDQPITVTLQGTIPRFATVDGKTLQIPRQIVPVNWLPNMAALGERQQNELTGPPQLLDETMQLTLPAGYRLGALPPARKIEQPFGGFEASAAAADGKLILHSRVETVQSLIPPAEYPAFRRFWASVDATLGRPIASSTANAAAASANAGTAMTPASPGGDAQ